MVRRSNKKGDISIAVIIGAAIALFVLVIVSVLILRAGDTVITQTSCENLPGGQCVNQGTACNTGKIRGSGSCPDGQVCCVDNPLRADRGNSTP